MRQIQSIDVVPMQSDDFIANCDRSDTSKRKREDCGLEDIRLRVENLLGLANELVNRDKPRQSFPVKPDETKSFGGYSTTTQQLKSINTPSRIPRRSLTLQETPNSGDRSRSVTPQRVVQSRIQFFEALSQNKDVYKTIMSQERQLGIERTSIPISVHIKASRHSLDAARPKVPLFNQVTPTQDKSIFVFAAPSPVRNIPRLVARKSAGSFQTIKRKFPLRNTDTPSKIPVLDKSKFFAGVSKIPINRKTG